MKFFYILSLILMLNNFCYASSQEPCRCPRVNMINVVPWDYVKPESSLQRWKVGQVNHDYFTKQHWDFYIPYVPGETQEVAKIEAKKILHRLRPSTEPVWLPSMNAWGCFYGEESSDMRALALTPSEANR